VHSALDRLFRDEPMNGEEKRQHRATEEKHHQSNRLSYPLSHSRHREGVMDALVGLVFQYTRSISEAEYTTGTAERGGREGRVAEWATQTAVEEAALQAAAVLQSGVESQPRL
jgi:predicted AAA+ superfamily ATPase